MIRRCSPISYMLPISRLQRITVYPCRKVVLDSERTARNNVLVLLYRRPLFLTLTAFLPEISVRSKNDRFFWKYFGSRRCIQWGRCSIFPVVFLTIGEMYAITISVIFDIVFIDEIPNKPNQPDIFTEYRILLTVGNMFKTFLRFYLYLFISSCFLVFMAQ